jgi:hypothetical protein
MGFGLAVLFLFPLSGVLLLLWVISGKSFYGKLLATIWVCLIVLIIVLSTIGYLVSDKGLRKDDYYGQYVINRNYFPGKQADWQYDSFRFEIKDNDSIYFYATEKQKVVRVFKGGISTVKPTGSERLVLHMTRPTHHILNDNPTTYRNAQGFYLVFDSPKFGNVFFKKGKWEPLNN